MLSAENISCLHSALLKIYFTMCVCGNLHVPLQNSFIFRVPSPEAADTIIVTIEDYYSDFLHMKDR